MFIQTPGAHQPDLPNSKKTSIVVLVNFYYTQPQALVVCKQVVRVRMCIQKGNKSVLRQRGREQREERALPLSKIFIAHPFPTHTQCVCVQVCLLVFSTNPLHPHLCLL